jgi:hypothetical protein
MDDCVLSETGEEVLYLVTSCRMKRVGGGHKYNLTQPKRDNTPLSPGRHVKTRRACSVSQECAYTPANSMSAKHVPEARAVHNMHDIKRGEMMNQYHHVNTIAITNKELETVMLGMLLFKKLTNVGSGNMINPISRLVKAWCRSTMAEMLCPTNCTVSFHSRAKLMPVRRVPQTKMAIMANMLFMMVM